MSVFLRESEEKEEISVTLEQAAEIFQELDRDGDGRITTGEFLKGLTGKRKDKLRAMFGAVGVSWKEVFGRFDKDKNGSIELQEFQNELQRAEEEAEQVPVSVLSPKRACVGWAPYNGVAKCGEPVEQEQSQKSRVHCQACFDKQQEWAQARYGDDGRGSKDSEPSWQDKFLRR
eukprot:TRINITY_DN17644_c0_g1_i1.p1 TRINITY_DN17644_c0_g1~~TRINITY_DN17644_c0_g1_i1.p1  ORF type:complete len:174 (+),score=55.71 TRINITY_DN17644_c0_g1_i1:179-700(+)